MMNRLCWLGILGVLVGLLISSSVVTPSTHAAPLSEEQAMPDLSASPTAIQHQAGTDQCTDWSVAQLADPTNPASKGDAVSNFELRNVPGVQSSIPGIEKLMPTSELLFDSEPSADPYSPHIIVTSSIWHVLIRPNQPFAVFYSTADPFTKDRVFDTPGANINYMLTLSHNCVITGRSITATLTITPTHAYSATLPVSIFDIEIRATGTFSWSDTVPAEERLTAVNLVPETPLTLQWVWTADRGLVQSYGSIAVTPSMKFQSPLAIDEVTGKYINIPVDNNGVDGVCQMP